MIDLAALEDRTPRGIAGAFSRAIRAGELAPGDRLPTVREVAAALGVSPATVSAAWQALRRTGLVVSRGRAGTFVHGEQTTWLSPRVRDLVGHDRGGDASARLDLSRGTPDPALLPALGPALARVSRRAETFAYQDEPVLPGLRDVLRATWPYAVDALTVVDGAVDGVGRVLEQVVSYGDRVVLESPGYPPFYDLVDALGAEVVAVELDDEGVRVDALRTALRSSPVAVVLQPRAHNPTGVSMTARRAERLARAVGRRGPWVVEDDHSGAISTAPAVSLGTWLPERVVHVHSYSKTHGPDLRIAALGGPAALVDRLVARRMLGPAWTSRMVQSILLDLLTTPASTREVAEARRCYQQRQEALVAALGRRGVRTAVPDGINLWLAVHDERAALLHLSAAGLRAAAGAPFVAQGYAGGPHVRVTSGLVTDPHLEEVATALAAAATAG